MQECVREGNGEMCFRSVRYIAFHLTTGTCGIVSSVHILHCRNALRKLAKTQLHRSITWSRITYSSSLQVSELSVLSGVIKSTNRSDPTPTPPCRSLLLMCYRMGLDQWVSTLGLQMFVNCNPAVLAVLAGADWICSSRTLGDPKLRTTGLHIPWRTQINPCPDKESWALNIRKNVPFCVADCPVY